MEKYLYYKKILKNTNGDTQANTNKKIPKTNFPLSSSITPVIVKITPNNPKITGKICENIVDPVIGI